MIMEFGLIIVGTLILLIPEETIYSITGIYAGNRDFPTCLIPAIIPMIGLGLIGMGFLMKYKHILMGCSRGILEWVESIGMGLLTTKTANQTN